METEFESFAAHDLALVAQLAGELREMSQRIAEKTQELEQLQAEYAAIEQKRLPDAMTDLGLKSIVLQDGSSLTIKPEYHVGIPKKFRDQAFAILRERGLDDIIKTELSLQFGRGEEAAAVALAAQLQATNPDRPIKIESAVHAGTLKALVKELHAGETPLPEEPFGVFIINRAVLTAPKSR